MGNTISLDVCGEHFSMSNGLTSVFISVLGLSGTGMAKNDDEKNMIVWLLEKDQSAVGSGAAGFDISEMPWRRAGFDDLKCFLLKAVEGARRKTGWEFLDYQPEEELLFPCLDRFYKLISDFNADMICETSVQEWWNDTAAALDDPAVCGYPRCVRHPVFLTVFGCQLCNDQAGFSLPGF